MLSPSPAVTPCPAISPSPTVTPPPAIIDLRSAAAHAIDRPAGAVRLAAQDLVDNPQLLPPRNCPLVLVGESVSVVAPLVDALRRAERFVSQHYPEESWRHNLPAETGAPSRVRLWEPARVVQFVVEAYARSLPRKHALATLADAPTHALPGRRALDLACGTGRNAVYLAMAGFEVTAVDILPDALARTRDLAARHGVTVTTAQRDLEAEGPLAGLTADVIVVVRFLERSLFPAIEAALTPGGFLAYETFTVEQRELGHPRNPRFLLQPGELRDAFSHLDILSHEIVFEGAHLERLVARRPLSCPR